MASIYDLAYWTGLMAAAPYWLVKGATRRKVLGALGERMGYVDEREGNSPAVMIHAVSLGEMNATRSLVRMLAEARPDLYFIICTTTRTGHERGMALYADNPRVTVIWYPLDFSSAVARVLDRLRPGVVALMELEVWPNFVRRCAQRGIPVVLINGRLTSRSFAGYHRIRLLVNGMFAGLTMVCAQEQAYAERFIALGCEPSRVRVTGTMKFDTATIAEGAPRDDALAREVGLADYQRLWVCGSTGPGEEEILLGAYRRLLVRFPSLRLMLVPRKPERFDEVAELIGSAGFECVRRSGKKYHHGDHGEETGKEKVPPGRGGFSRRWEEQRRLKPPLQASSLETEGPHGEGDAAPPVVILGDTMGELRRFYALAEVVFVGRTLLDLGTRQHGSDMIEPAALGRPVVVGPFTGNFAEPMSQFRAANAIVEVETDEELTETLSKLLSEPTDALAMGERAQDVVRSQQGATAKHVEVILQAMKASGHDR